MIKDKWLGASTKRAVHILLHSELLWKLTPWLLRRYGVQVFKHTTASRAGEKMLGSRWNARNKGRGRE